MNGSVDRRQLTFMAMAGLAGGAIGWIPVELAARGHSLTQNQTAWTQLAGIISMALLWALIGGLIIASESQTLEITPRTTRDFLRGFVICFVIGLPAVYYANVLFTAVLIDGGWGVNRAGAFGWLILARTIGWAFTGLMLGIAVGGATLSLNNLVKGGIGGLTGGFIGGLLFDPISMGGGGGLLSRLIGLSVLGLAIGLAIGLVQELTKNAWLVVEAGRLAGRQFRLEKSTVTVGRAEENAVGLFGDPHVQARHALLTRQSDGWSIKSIAIASGTTVNGNVVETAPLRDGDRIGIGDYLLRFNLRQGARAPGDRQAAFIHTPRPDTAISSGPRQPFLIDGSGNRYAIQPAAPTRMGRALDNDIVVSHPSVSRHHAQIVAANGGFELHDLSSQNGTYVSGQRIGEARINDGDTIALGDAPFTFRA
ncbi:MAG: FHA domain-containing protein [Candidatus Binataceae bacterium]|nr:FHA domain-containing protein [Candidatus Binataceae bacterium]